jgi:phospholipase A1/A2
MKKTSLPFQLLCELSGVVIVAAPVWAQATPPHVPAPVSANPSVVSNYEQCLLQAIKEAPAQMPVEQLRQRCSSWQAPQLAPTDQVTLTASTSRAPAAPSITASAEMDDLIPQIKSLLEKPASEQSVIERRMVSEIRSSLEPFSLLPHRPNYLLPLSYQRRRQDSQATASAYEPLESHFQISFKFPLTKPLLGGQVLPFFGYTNRSWWQVYDAERSRPFREYNHEAELFALIPASGLKLLGWEHRMSMVGFSHQSNGRDVPRSRSWNRLTGEVYFDHSRHTWGALKAWYRIPEKDKLDPTDTKGDDNPDILKYMGNFELRVGHALPGSHNLSLMARQSFKKNGKGALQLDWSHPVRYSPGLRWYASVFSGYGDSLIDYNHKVTRAGLGIMLKDWF